MARYLPWQPARDLARTGKAIRRDAWRKWLVPSTVIWFIQRTDTDGNALRYVVPQSEFTSAEFLAKDWTDEPWVDPVTGIAVVPPAGIITTGSAAPPPDDSPPPSGGWGTIDNPPGPGAINPPPPPGVIFGGVTPGPPRDPPTLPNPPVGQAPVITINIFAPPDNDLEAAAAKIGQLYSGGCFSDTGSGVSPMILSELGFTVSVAGGPAGLWFLSYTLSSGTPPHTDNAFPGFTADREFTNVRFFPGGTVTITATYVANGVSYTGSGSYTFPGVCACPTGGTVTVALSGIAACGCGALFKVTNFSGLNGVHTLAWDAGSSSYKATGVGSITMTGYSDTDCTMETTSGTGSFNIFASCSVSLGSPVWSVSVIEPPGPPISLGFPAFSTAAAKPAGAVIPNAANCPPSSNGLGGGSATVSFG